MANDFDQYGSGPDDLGRPGPDDLGDDPFAHMVDGPGYRDRFRAKRSRRFLSVGLGFYSKLKKIKGKK